MNVRAFLNWAESQGQLMTIACPVDPRLEIARLMHALEGRPLLFTMPHSRPPSDRNPLSSAGSALTRPALQYPRESQDWTAAPQASEPGATDYRPQLLASDIGDQGRTPMHETSWRVAAGLCARREHFAWALGTDVVGIVPRLVEALNHPVSPPSMDTAPCQEVVNHAPDLNALPILRHLPDDGGRYITAGVSIIRDPEYGRNVSFHRLMQIGPRSFSGRIVEGRGTDTAWRKAVAAGKDLEIAICLGVPIHVLLAAAMSPAKGVDELGIAHALSSTPLGRCVTIDLEVPAECEAVLEGRITSRLAGEGPFIDLTGTWDLVRQQPVIEIDCLTHRREPIYHALLPGGLEHKLLMGLPREPTIFKAVADVTDCRDVSITPGGMSWLHAVVQISKRGPDDGRRAAEAAFRGHGSLKHVVVVDEDIDIHDSASVEWAIATRFQAGRDLILMTDQPSSSLDPSAKLIPGQKARSDKLGLDATIPWTDPSGRPLTEAERAGFLQVRYAPVDLSRYLSPIGEPKC